MLEKQVFLKGYAEIRFLRVKTVNMSHYRKKSMNFKISRIKKFSPTAGFEPGPSLPEISSFFKYWNSSWSFFHHIFAYFSTTTKQIINKLFPALYEATIPFKIHISPCNMIPCSESQLNVNIFYQSKTLFSKNNQHMTNLALMEKNWCTQKLKFCQMSPHMNFQLNFLPFQS